MAAIGGNYPQPVLVNGYECWNCHDVSEAKKNINPAHPDQTGVPPPSSTRPGAVTFGGVLAGLSGASDQIGAASQAPPPQTGAVLDVTA